MIFKMSILMATPNTSSTFLNFNSLQGKFKIKFFVSQNKKLSRKILHNEFIIKNFRMKYHQIFRLKTTKI